jgi:Ca-activated chloride channel homolog
VRRRDTRIARMCTAAIVAAFGLQPAMAEVLAQTPSFKASVDVVSVTAVVRDSRGRPVRNLGREDFQVYERGKLRQIVQFKSSDQGPISLAVLFDVSGSMRGTQQMEAGQRAVEHILSWVDPAQDEIGLFSFDAELRREVDFTTDVAKIKRAVQSLTALGQTSLYDAISKTAATLGNRPSPRRAVVVITDGIDTSSKLTPAQVSGMASAIDVPVYVVAVLSPIDHPGTDYAVVGADQSPVATHLSNLSYWTGGTLFMVSAPAHASQAARDLITELRHQYLIAFEAAREPGWYDLDVRTRRRELTVRARSGYFSQSRQG